ncbi:hypothetical protein F7725_011666 [Dissostichus mawsoni]|uniref:Uncharacterized protein n=1 Tax=Dissostichus mawsoni TaxID=36200 RepID=A0A7J5Z9P0_DISMA|nr:hypothetical protein F7725_011666 [Dissostichus mawsoni]
MRDRPETDADLGTFPAGDLGFSGVSSWWAMRRDAPLRKDGLVPVLLLRSRMRCSSHLPLGPSARLSPLAKCLFPSHGERPPLPSQRSSFSSLWLRSDDDRLWLDGVEVDRCSVLLYTWCIRGNGSH